jgi:hypothetical protein
MAAMIWMVLVGMGLLLICWRLLRNKERPLADQRQSVKRC